MIDYDQLRTASPEELHRLRASIDLILTGAASNTQAPTETAENPPSVADLTEPHRYLVQELRRLGHEGATPVSVMTARIKGAADGLKTLSRIAYRYAEDNTQLRVIVYRKIVRIVAAAIDVSEAPLSYRTLSLALRDTEGHLDNAFPGYALAGLLGPVLTKGRLPAERITTA